MKTFFNLNAQRHFTTANAIFYPVGKKHPDRIFETHDFIYFTSGNWEILQNGERICAETGDVVVLTAWEHHYGEKPCLDGTRNMYFHVTAAETERLLTDDGTAPGVPLGTLIHCRDHPEVEKLFSRIVETFTLRETNREEWLSVLFAELILTLREAEQDSGEESPELVRELSRLMLAEPGRFFSNQELAEHFFICERTFVKRFRIQSGTTPHHFQMQKKLRSIRDLMYAEPELTLKELSGIFGFYDEFHLSRAFKQEYGVSPGMYRKTEKAAAETERRNQT